MKKLSSITVVGAVLALGVGMLVSPIASAETRTFTNWFNSPNWPGYFGWTDSPEYASAIASQFCKVSGDSIADVDLAGFDGGLDIAGTINPMDSGTAYPFNIEALEGLTMLDASDNYIQDISFINSMPNLEYLNVSGNLIQNLYVVDWTSLPNLKTLILANNPVADLTPLVDSSVEVLDIVGTNVMDVSYLIGSSITDIYATTYNFEPFIPGLDDGQLAGLDRGGIRYVLDENAPLTDIPATDCTIIDPDPEPEPGPGTPGAGIGQTGGSSFTAMVVSGMVTVMALFGAAMLIKKRD